MDKMKDGSQQLKFLVFDVLIVDRKNLMRRSLSTRLGVFALVMWDEELILVFHGMDFETVSGVVEGIS